MATFIMLTKLSHEALACPRSFEELSAAIVRRLREECRDVTWGGSFVLLGPMDFLDVFDAPDIKAAARVATLVRSFGHATTEIWPAIECDRFAGIVQRLDGDRRATIGDRAVAPL